MAGNDAFNPLNLDWMQAQKRYWDAWSALAAVSPGNPVPGAFGPLPRNPWSDSLDQWWKAVSGGVPGESREFWDRVMGQGKGFMQFGQLFMQTLEGVSKANQAGEDWRRQLEAQFEALKALCSQSTAQFGPAWQGMNNFCQMPLDTWRRMSSSMSLMPGDALHGLRDVVFDHLGERLHTEVDRFLSVPGVGYTREAQEEAQTGARLMLDYQKVFGEYVAAHGELSSQTLDRLLKRLLAMGEKGDQVTSLRALYDLWVDVGEEVYAEFVMRPEFADLYGRLVNALMAVKRQGREMVDEVLGALNMPTREEINTVLGRQQELRRQVRTLQERGVPAGGSDDSRMVDALQAEIANLRAELAQARRPAPATVATEAASPRPAAEPVVEAPAAKPAAAAPARSTRGAAAKPAQSAQRAGQAPKAAKAWDVSSLMPNTAAETAGGRGARGKK